MAKAFLCHASVDSDFVVQVGAYLKRHLDHVFAYEEHQHAGAFTEIINRNLAEICDVFVVFYRTKLTVFQQQEIDAVVSDLGQGRKAWSVFLVPIPDENLRQSACPTGLALLRTHPQIWPLPNERSPLIDQPLDAVQQLAGPAHLPPGYAAYVAKRIVKSLQLTVIPDDDLPANPHLFDYEKDIIDFYLRKRELGENLWKDPKLAGLSADQRRAAERIIEKLKDGCPPNWPVTERCANWSAAHTNPLTPEHVGQQDGAKVVAAALSTYQGVCGNSGTEWNPGLCMHVQRLAFDEARPRSGLHFPTGNRRSLGVAILVSGGIAPGINAVIDGIVQRHWTYLQSSNFGYSLHVSGLINGFHAFDLPFGNPRILAESDFQTGHRVPPAETASRANDGGCFLGTSRLPALVDETTRSSELTRIVRHLQRDCGVDILYVIGGDGSMKAAHALWSTAKAEQIPLSVVAVPKTMDNDILWMWQSFGFLSAVEKGREIIELLHTEVNSNPRLCVVQLFGSDSGFVVSHAVLASATGQCDAALIPEVPFSMKRLARHVQGRLSSRGGPIPHGLVVMAETAIPLDAEEYCDLDDVGLSHDEKQKLRAFCNKRLEGRRIEGQTDDDLRSAGLKVVSKSLVRLLRDMPNAPQSWVKHLRVVTNEPRHVLRSIRPSCADIIMGQRLGTLAVDNAMAGFTDFMISQWLTEYVLVPLKLVVLGRKRIPRAGIFWKSVLAKTGQELRMYDDTDLQKYDPNARG